jgi:hypothetical protein
MNITTTATITKRGTGITTATGTITTRHGVGSGKKTTTVLIRTHRRRDMLIATGNDTNIYQKTARE